MKSLHKASFVLAALLFCSSTFSGPCDSVPTFADGKQPLREIFVSPAAGDPAADGTRAHPFQTIAHALQKARPGDAVRLLPGTYSPNNSVNNLAGAADAPIWIGGEPGQPRPLINGGSGALHFSRVRYLVIENIEVSAASGNGVNCDDGGDYAETNATHHLIFRNLAIHDIGTGGNNDGLKLSGLNNYAVLNCQFDRVSAGGSGIDQVGCHHGLIARCAFTDMGNSIQCKGGSEDIEIRANRFINGGGRTINIGGSTGFTFFRPPLSKSTANFEAKNIRVLANLFRGSEAPIAFVGSIDSLVANNTIVNPSRWIARILQETVSRDGYNFAPCGRNQFLNNLVWYGRDQISTHVNVGANTDSASFEFANNLWYASDQLARSRPVLPVAEQNGLYGLDPGFQNVSAGDFSLAAHSPAVGKGKRLSALSVDLFGNCYANPPAIGASEANAKE